MPFEKLVRDFMQPLDRYPVLRADETIRAALRQVRRSFDQQTPPYLIVVDGNEAAPDIIKGFLTPSDIVFGIAGHFLKGVEKTGPIFWEGQLESECRHAIEKTVEDIMTPVQVCIRADEMVMEAIFLLNRYQVDILPVVQAEEVAGMIHLTDILRQISLMSVA